MILSYSTYVCSGVCSCSTYSTSVFHPTEAMFLVMIFLYSLKEPLKRCTRRLDSTQSSPSAAAAAVVWWWGWWLSVLPTWTMGGCNSLFTKDSSCDTATIAPCTWYVYRATTNDHHHHHCHHDHHHQYNSSLSAAGNTRRNIQVRHGQTGYHPIHLHCLPHT